MFSCEISQKLAPCGEFDPILVTAAITMKSLRQFRILWIESTSG